MTEPFSAVLIADDKTWGLRFGVMYHRYDGHWVDLNIVLGCVRFTAVLILKKGRTDV